MTTKQWKKLNFMFCSAAGAFFIALYDLYFSDRQSLVVKSAEAIRKIFTYWDSSAIAGLLLIVLFACYVTHVKSPRTKRDASEIGLGIVALLTTLCSPLKQEAISGRIGASLWAYVAYAQDASFQKSSPKLSIEVKGTEPSEIFDIQIRDVRTDKIIETKQSGSGEKTDFQNIDIDREYQIYLEGKNHRWTKVKLVPKSGSNAITIQPPQSKIPMLIQRFFGPTELPDGYQPQIEKKSNPQ